MVLFERKPTGAEAEEGAQQRLRVAEEGLASPDLYTREAGAQALAGLTVPDGLRLLETACADREGRVVEGGLRALLASAATDDPKAETALLRVLTNTRTGARARELLTQGGKDRLGALPETGYDARHFQFLAANPDLARCRLASLQSGSFRSIQAFRSQRLRADPAFTALFEVIRSDPDLSRALKALLARRAEFLQQGPEPRSLEPFWGDIRRMTGLLAGFAADPALTALCQIALDRSVARQTQIGWQRLKTDIPFVPELVVGSGPHSANLCSALAILRPEHPPLVVERRERLGGQFAAPEGAAWFLNSRARPSSADRRARPETGQMLNTLGAYAPVQEADLTGQSYAAQERLALATRLSLFLSAQTLVDTAFVQRFPNTADTRQRLGLPAQTPALGRYLVQLENVRTGDTGYLTTDALLFAGGLGEPNLAFGDSASRQAALVERERARRGQPARYYTFEDFMARLTDPNVPFPLRGLQRVIVLGSGDSARVVVEALLGYGPPAGRTVHGLDRVQEVIWIGQKAITREQFLACERPRYHLLASEFPRAGQASATGRIRPVPERAARFALDNANGVVTTTVGQLFLAPAVIDCTGFRPVLPGAPLPLTELASQRKSARKLRLCDAFAAETELVLTYRTVPSATPNTAKRRLEGTVQRVLGRFPLSGAVAFITDECASSDRGAELERGIRSSLGLAENARFYLKSTVRPAIYATLQGTRRPIARQEGAERIFYLGPQAGLPLPEDSTTGTVGEPDTTAALWRYAYEVTAFAEYYIANLPRREPSPPAFDLGFSPRELRRSGSRKEADDLLKAPVTKEGQTASWPPVLDTRRLLRYLISEHLRGFRLPAEIEARTLRLRLTPVPAPASGGVAFLEVQTATPVIERVGIAPVLEALGTDPLLQRAVFQWGAPAVAVEKRNTRVTPLVVEIALRRGRLQLLEMRTEAGGASTDWK